MTRPIMYPIKVSSGVTRVIEAGTGQAVIFVHGLGARADRWQTTVARIAASGYRAVAYDLHGHGFASKELSGARDVPDLARQTLAVMDALEIESAVLAGTSLGAHIAAYAACLSPQRVRALALIGALGIVPIAQSVAETIARNVCAQQREQFYGKLRFVLHDPEGVTEALVEEEWRMNTAPGTLDIFSRFGAYLVDGIERDYVGEKLAALYSAERLLLIWGAHDKAVPPEIGEACSKVLNGAGLSLIDGANHVPYAEQPAAFDAVLLPFLRRSFGETPS